MKFERRKKRARGLPLKSVPTYPTLITTFFLRKGSHLLEGVGRE